MPSRSFKLLTLILLIGGLTWNTAQAKILTVTTTEDTTSSSDGVLSLREAVVEANTTTEADEIILPSGTYTLSQGASLLISSDIAITGVSAESTIIRPLDYAEAISVIEGTTQFSLTHITVSSMTTSSSYQAIRIGSDPAIVSLNHCIIKKAPTGLSIYRAMQVTINDCIFDDNKYHAIDNSDPFIAINVNRSTFTNNGNDDYKDAYGSTLRGGAIDHSDGGTLVIRDSQFSGNKASTGGAIYSTYGSDDGGTISIYKTTFSDNSADYGSAIYTRSQYGYRAEMEVYVSQSSFIRNVNAAIYNVDRFLYIDRSTFSQNDTGVYDDASSSYSYDDASSSYGVVLDRVTLSENKIGITNIGSNSSKIKNSLLSGNDSLDCDGGITSQGYNLISDVSGCTITATTGDQFQVATANLSEFYENDIPGGSYYELLSESTAIDQGNPEYTEVDQLSRGVAGGRVDIGAVEHITDNIEASADTDFNVALKYQTIAYSSQKQEYQWSVCNNSSQDYTYSAAFTYASPRDTYGNLSFPEAEVAAGECYSSPWTKVDFNAASSKVYGGLVDGTYTISGTLEGEPTDGSDSESLIDEVTQTWTMNHQADSSSKESPATKTSPSSAKTSGKKKAAK